MERFRVIARRVAVRAAVRDGNYALPMSGRKKGGSDGRAPGGFAHHLRELSGSVFRRAAGDEA